MLHSEQTSQACTHKAAINEMLGVVTKAYTCFILGNLHIQHDIHALIALPGALKVQDLRSYSSPTSQPHIPHPRPLPGSVPEDR